MSFQSILRSLHSRWFRSLVLFESRSRKSRSLRRAGLRNLPQLESLEERVVPAPILYTVTIPGDAGGVSGTQDTTRQNAGDLRYVIDQADLPVNNNSTIQFATSSPINLVNGELEISENMTIVGPASAANQAEVSGNFL